MQPTVRPPSPPRRHVGRGARAHPVAGRSAPAAPVDLRGITGRSATPEQDSCGLTVVVTYSQVPLVTVTGELDVATATLLRAVLEHVGRRATRPAEVDLRGVWFADSHGLEPVLDVGATVVAASEAVRLVLAALGAAGWTAASCSTGRRRLSPWSR